MTGCRAPSVQWKVSFILPKLCKVLAQSFCAGLWPWQLYLGYQNCTLPAKANPELATNFLPGHYPYLQKCYHSPFPQFPLSSVSEKGLCFLFLTFYLLYMVFGISKSVSIVTTVWCLKSSTVSAYLASYPFQLVTPFNFMCRSFDAVKTQ